MTGGSAQLGDGRAGLLSRLLFHGATDVDEVVGDDAEADPAVHADIALVAAAREAVSPFDNAMRPSHPVRHFWPSRNQRFLCSRLRSRLLVERLGMQTRLTPFHVRICERLGVFESNLRCRRSF